MKQTILVVSIVVALAVGGGIGYLFGMSADASAAKNKELQDSVVMMKQQSAIIQAMGAMMKTSGVAMQEIGMKYKDDVLVSQGKDMEALGEKYIKDNAKVTEGGTMKKVME